MGRGNYCPSGECADQWYVDYDGYRYDEEEGERCEEIDFDLLQDDIRKMTLGYKITPESSFVGNGMKGFLKRAVWRVNGFWVSQLAAQQSWFNNSAARGFIQTKNHILQQQDTIDMLRKRIARMERELEHLKENQDREI